MATKATPFDDIAKAAYDTMQALGRKQQEMLAEALKGIQDAAEGAAGGAGFADPVRQAELARKTCEKALADIKELAEIARKSQADAIASITQRAAASMQEARNLMQWPPASPKKK